MIAIGLGFVAYRIAIAVIPDMTGLAVSVLLGVIVAASVWKLTAPKSAG